MVSAPNSQVRPYRDMMPAMLIMRRMVECLSLDFEALNPVSLLLCLWRMRTKTMMINTAKLKRIMTRMGARKAAKKAVVLLMKQLWRAGTKTTLKFTEVVSVCLDLQASTVVLRLKDDIIRIDSHWNDHWKNWRHCRKGIH